MHRSDCQQLMKRKMKKRLQPRRRLLRVVRQHRWYDQGWASGEVAPIPPSMRGTGDDAWDPLWEGHPDEDDEGEEEEN